MRSGRLGGIGGRLGAPWGASQGAWGILGRFRRLWGGLGAAPRETKVDIDCIFTYQKRCPDGRCLVSLGDPLGCFGIPWETFGLLLRVPWCASVAIWEPQGTPKGPLGLAFEPFGVPWGACRGPLECLTWCLGNPWEVSKGFGEGLGLLP